MNRRVWSYGLLAAGFLLSSVPSVQADGLRVVTHRFDTATQMLLANEINESGEPFAEALGYNLDDLDPFIPGSPDVTAYTLGIENYEYSRYQLGTVITRSGIGLHMMWAPLVRKAAAMEPPGFDGSLTGVANGFNEDDELVKTIGLFSRLAHHKPPGNPWPQFAEFASGDPHLPQPVDAQKFAWEDFSTLRWDRNHMLKQLRPAAMGQSLMKQYLWASDMLSAFHDVDDNGIDADGVVSPDLPGSPLFDPDNNVFYGGDSLDGFIGMVITAESINKVAFLTSRMAFDGKTLGSIDLANYDPGKGIRYFPASIQVVEQPVQQGLPPRLKKLKVVDRRSRLFDQASLLWGLSSFVNMMDPTDRSDSAHLAYREVFDGSPFPASRSETGKPGPYDLMKGTARAVFLNILAMHKDAGQGTFVDTAALTRRGVRRSHRVNLVSAAYLIVALEPFIEEFSDTPLGPLAENMLEKQAEFIMNHAAKPNGLYGLRVNLRKDRIRGSGRLLAQAAAVRALYVANRVSGRADFGQAADAAYRVLIDRFWLPGRQVFRSRLGEDEARYTPRNFALTAGALREAALQGGHAAAVDQYVAFFRNIGNRMQLSEAAPTGETGGDSDQDGVPFVPEQADRLPPVFATRAILDLDR